MVPLNKFVVYFANKIINNISKYLLCVQIHFICLFTINLAYILRK